MPQSWISIELDQYGLENGKGVFFKSMEDFVELRLLYGKKKKDILAELSKETQLHLAIKVEDAHTDAGEAVYMLCRGTNVEFWAVDERTEAVRRITWSNLYSRAEQVYMAESEAKEHWKR